MFYTERKHALWQVRQGSYPCVERRAKGPFRSLEELQFVVNQDVEVGCIPIVRLGMGRVPNIAYERSTPHLKGAGHIRRYRMTSDEKESSLHNPRERDGGKKL